MFESLNPEDPIPSECLEIFEEMYTNLWPELPDRNKTINHLYYKTYKDWKFNSDVCDMWDVKIEYNGMIFNEHTLRIIPLKPLGFLWKAKDTLIKCDSRLGEHTGNTVFINREYLPTSKKYAVVGILLDNNPMKEPKYTKIIYTSHLSYPRIDCVINGVYF